MNLYKLNCGGIVYLVDPKTARAYTYDVTNPTPIGHIVWNDPKTLPWIDLDESWQTTLETKRKSCQAVTAATTAPPTTDASAAHT
jgi:hypothetical protein